MFQCGRFLSGLCAAAILTAAGPRLAGAGLDFGIDLPGLGLGRVETGSGSLLIPMRARTAYMVRENGLLEVSLELAAGLIVGEERPRHFVEFTINNERESDVCEALACLLPLRFGGMAEASDPGRFGLTGGWPLRFWHSDRRSSRLVIEFTWLFQKQGSPAMAMLFVTFGPAYFPEGRSGGGRNSGRSSPPAGDPD